ncbi:hypothetical protein acsn021_29270 [Anaerocolumna cellulosilytica]|uniref:Uncharacterized protein n=1 Tax=Anaerocolumna cellulosilytica TaxID=433286 RepID=A0A6S6R8R1_9FIRM|nr:hypothetical protein [Anaerocolumna cellulosilytica]MBB5197145.1 RNA polymerase sigma factor (sigma-70 family) [Anaerocolumna cellulosilytica]BCJ95358.1 hypothetical protein acsn021_29270 [Anaerocolumna cellulosilytica]
MGTRINAPDEKFIEFYDQYFELVYRICFLYMNNNLDAQIMVQSVFTKYQKSKIVFLNGEHAKVWVITTVVGLCDEVLKPWRYSVFPYAVYNDYNTPEDLLAGMKNVLSQKNVRLKNYVKETPYTNNNNIVSDDKNHNESNSETNHNDDDLIERNLESDFKQFILSRLLGLPKKYIAIAYMYYQERYTVEDIGRYLKRSERCVAYILKRCSIALQSGCKESEKLEIILVQKVIEEIKPDIELKEKLLDNISKGTNLLEKQNFYQLYKYYIYCRIIVAVSICLIILIGSFVMRQEKDRFYINGTNVEITEATWVEDRGPSFSFTVEGNSIDLAVFASENHYLKNVNDVIGISELYRWPSISSYINSTMKATAYLMVEQKENKNITIAWTPKSLNDSRNKGSRDLNYSQFQEETDVILYQIQKDDQSINQGGIEIKRLSDGQVSARLISIPNSELKYRLKKVKEK